MGQFVRGEKDRRRTFADDKVPEDPHLPSWLADKLQDRLLAEFNVQIDTTYGE